ncbi:MAG: uL15 family ribosomal protein [Oscillospiraceae bacterium]|nr:uL15 family ribosomal protein [Oscillospiraceae bacterium]
MNIFIIIFMVIASIFAIGTLGYVTVDIVLEIRNKDKPEEEKKEEPVVVAAPIVDAAPEVMPEFVEHIDAEEADAMISDSLAMKTANYESGAGHGQQGIINIGVLDDNFNAHDVITLAVLKEKGLISSKVGRMKVLADGMLNKPLTIKSESYSIQAIKMIELTGGTVIILRD